MRTKILTLEYVHFRLEVWSFKSADRKFGAFDCAKAQTTIPVDTVMCSLNVLFFSYSILLFDLNAVQRLVGGNGAHQNIIR